MSDKIQGQKTDIKKCLRRKERVRKGEGLFCKRQGGSALSWSSSELKRDKEKRCGGVLSKTKEGPGISAQLNHQKNHLWNTLLWQQDSPAHTECCQIRGQRAESTDPLSLIFQMKKCRLRKMKYWSPQLYKTKAESLLEFRIVTGSYRHHT